MRAFPFGLLMAGCLLLGACEKITPIPAEQTSFAVNPGVNPGPPPTELSLVWLHHSTGDSILQGGLLAALRANRIDFYDINYEEAEVDGYVIGNHTDPPDFPKTFNTAKYFDVVRSWELKGKRKQHDIVMFKSCFPASKIESDKQLEQYKSYYLSMIPTFNKHPQILFIAMSTPPLVAGWTTPEQGKRARRWAKWITTEYPKKASNVRVFDLFEALAVREGYPKENMLVPQFSQAVRDAHPSPAGAKAVTRLFVPWLNRTIREAGLVSPPPASNDAGTEGGS